MNLHACPFLPAKNLAGTWYRAMHPRHLASPLATAHTATLPGRFNPGTAVDPAFEILYLAENATVALVEVQALLGSPYPGGTFVPNPTGTWIVVQFQLHLQAVVDLTRVASQRLLQTTVQELTGDWRGYYLRNPTRVRGETNGSDVPTQKLGLGLERVRRIEAFVCYSARFSSRRNLIVFPKKLRKGSWVRFADPKTAKIHEIRG